MLGSLFIFIISTWSTSELSSLRVRITNIASNVGRDFSLDWIPVRVSYIPAAPTPTATATGGMGLAPEFRASFQLVSYQQPALQAQATNTPKPSKTPTPTPTSAATNTATAVPSATASPTASLTPTLLPAGPITVNYIYDPLNRLSEANYSTGDYYHYEYDAVGNRLTQNTLLGSVPFTTTYVYDNANRIQSVSGVTYSFDANGNLLNDGVNTYSYDSANRLRMVNRPSSMVSYAYNGLGDRLSQNGVNYTLDLNSGLTQVLNDGTNTYLYGAGRIAQVNTGTEYFLGDALGSVRQLTDASGDITLAKQYDPYGSVAQSVGSGESIYAYTGEQTDVSGLTYLRARYYSSGTGRFLTRDTWMGEYNRPSSLNRWLYVEANPINYTDPSGYILDPSDPTQRGSIIHEMIQAQYGSVYTTGDVSFEEYIPLGKASGLAIQLRRSGILYVQKPEGLYGFADIIDFGEGGLYEIKPISAPDAGLATAVIYMKAWNDAVLRREARRSIFLEPGLRYPLNDTIVGTDPNDPSKWVKAKLLSPGGVILYWAAKKVNHQPIPVFVFEWNPKKQRVEKQSSIFQPAPAPAPVYTTDDLSGFLEWLLNCGGFSVIPNSEGLNPLSPVNENLFDID